MSVRNFWVDADIDGRQTMLSGGPRAENGGMDVTVYQRDDGGIRTVVRIICRRQFNGKLVTYVDVDGERVATVETER